LFLISICIITYQRPEGLRRLLDAINHLAFDKIEQPEIEVVVIDNDVAGTAVDLCERLQPGFKWVLKAGIEPRRGISYARNRSISTADKRAGFIVIVDDDEVPEPQWLEQLLLVQKNHNADIVAAPVLPFFPDRDVPDWVKRGKFFELPRYSTGEPLQVAFTNNVLVRAEMLRQFDRPFGEQFSLTGGEDSHLFMGLERAGAKIVWANEAIVYEWVPHQRATGKYILQRSYRTWSTHSLIEREFYPSFSVQLIRLIKGLGLIAIGLVRLIPSLFQRKEFTIIALRYICRGCGTISGLLGFHYEEYKKI
jgi:glycosyltransferase involved in cell wall biosynthesis